jgi:hypothetical protein
MPPMTEEELNAAIETHNATVKEFEESTDGMSSSEAKQLPWVQRLQADSARKTELENKIAADKETADKAASDRAIKAAEKSKDYAEAQRLKDEESTRKIDAADKRAMDAESKALHSSLKSELLAAGFDPRSLKVLASEYDPEKFESIEAFAKASATDEANKLYLSTSQKRQTATPPGDTNVQGTEINWDEVKVWEQSEKPEERAKARDALRKYRSENKGEYPYKLE